jgi:hypothetical protein
MENQRKYERAVSRAHRRGTVETAMDEDLIPPSPRYPVLFHRILAGLKGETRADANEKLPGLDPRDRTFSKFLIDVPEVTEEAIDRIVRGYCLEPERSASSF